MCLQTDIGKAGIKFVVVRPNDRLWVTDVDGRVEKTIILREAIKRSHSQIPLINPSNMAGDEDTNVARVSPLEVRRSNRRRFGDAFKDLRRTI